MERLTTNKEVSKMGMYELAHNSCYPGENGAVRYRDYENDIDIRELARILMEKHTGIELSNEDDTFDEEIMDYESYGLNELEGLIAVFYRNLWALSDLREKLADYEDVEEQGMLLELPYPLGTEKIYYIVNQKCIELNASKISITKMPIGGLILFEIDGCEFIESDFGRNVFLTKEEAEQALKDMESEG